MRCTHILTVNHILIGRSRITAYTIHVHSSYTTSIQVSEHDRVPLSEQLKPYYVKHILCAF